MPIWLIAFIAAFIIGTFAEYWGHRFMHRWLFRKIHAQHHKEGFGQGWLKECKDYLVGASLLLPLGFFGGLEIGLGWLAGGIFYGMFAAYCHQLQHEKPELCFWLPQPVHFIHHHHHQWKHNFGISFDIWDRVFGTYKKMDWEAPKREGKRNYLGLFTIKWV